MFPSSVASSEPIWRHTMTRSLPVEQNAWLRGAFGFLLLSTTLLERFGINLGSYSLNAAMLGMYGFLGVAAFSGVLLISVARLSLYGCCVGLALLSAMLNELRTSLLSLLLLGAIYLPYVFVVKPNTTLGKDPTWIPKLFLNIAFFAALAGIIQFYAQIVIHSDWLFDFTAYIPKVLRGPSGFNTVIPVGTLRKSNGFFFREPSGFSFMMALALIVEAVSYRRLHRFACFALALLLSYSGTGLLVLLLGMLFPLGRQTISRMALLVCVGGLVLWLLGDAMNLSFTVDRVGEFDSERSSGYIRYIAPLRLIRDTNGTEVWTAWLGHGPGTISREIQGYEFHDPTWAKLLFEYGVAGFVAFLTLFLVVLHRREVAPQVRAAMFFGWLLSGGHLLSPELNFLTLSMVGLIPRLPIAPRYRRLQGTRTLPTVAAFTP
jgi:hypothetical protein